MKNYPAIVLATALLLTGCNGKVEQIPTATNPYPGNPEENFAPEIVKDPSYKNLALHRRAYASSSWDYNLTAQLATDGIVETNLPAYFVLSTSSGLVARNEHDWMFDMKVNTGCTLSKSDDYFQLDLQNYNLQFDSILVSGRVDKVKKSLETYYGVPGQEDGAIDPVYQVRRSNGLTWTVSLLGSKDGQTWETLDSANGKGGTIYQTLSKEGEFNHYRLAFSSPQADSWYVADWDFYGKNDKVQRVYGKRMETHRRDIMRPLAPPFTSCWMSGNGTDQWIYVDLGTKASIDNIVLHWLGEIPAGQVEISDDAENWQNVGTIENELKVSKDARYVKLALNTNAPCILSEFEVYGTNGVTVVPKKQPKPTDKRLDLAGGNWKLQRANLVAEDGCKISEEGYDDSKWVVATVPATVLSSYINIGAVPDPNYSDNQLQVSDSYFSSDFWYRDSFTLPKSFNDKKVYLNFDGINWKADIFLNGQSIGHIDGAFYHGLFDVSKYLREGVNCLAVKILKTPLPGCIKEQTAESTDSNGGIIGSANPTFHASAGWDWIPTIRGRNIGIWNDVYLATTGDVRISDPYIRTELNLPDTTVATVYVEATLNNASDHPVKGALTGNFGDYEFNSNVDINAGESKVVRLDAFKIENPQLWWPVGYGIPHLYDTKIAFILDGNESDCVEFKSGIRQMTYSTDSLGALNMYVNGRRFVGRGGNWGFAESNLRYRGREYDIAVKYHADMNFTMIRNWVGQVVDEEFYEACDRHGVMIWQDFWLANPWDGPDPYDEKMFMDNALDYIKHIRNHASIGLYCGRNEAMPPQTLDTALRALVAQQHPDIIYISHSAADGVSGGGPYRALPVENYFNMGGGDRTHSERGMPNVMNYENLSKTIPQDKLFPQTSLWGLHDFTLKCAQYCSSFNDMLYKGFGDIDDIHTYCKYAQWINYNGYRAMFEGKSKYRQGLLLWMSHPCWPSLVWQTYDYFFEPTAAYFGCKKACEPLHVQYNPLSKRVEVVNVSGRDRKSLNVVAKVYNLSGNKVWEDKCEISSKEDCTTECMPIKISENITDVYFIRLELYDGEKLESDNFYWQGVENGNYQAVRQLPAPELQVETSFTKGDQWTATTTVQNHTGAPALMLRAKLVDDKGQLILPVIYSDNYFSLMPGESKTITISFASSDFTGQNPQIVIE